MKGHVIVSEKREKAMTMITKMEMTKTMNKTTMKNENDDAKQGRIHSHQSRVRVGRSSDKKGLPKHLGRSGNKKTAHNAEKANVD